MLRAFAEHDVDIYRSLSGPRPGHVQDTSRTCLEHIQSMFRTFSKKSHSEHVQYMFSTCLDHRRAGEQAGRQGHMQDILPENFVPIDI